MWGNENEKHIATTGLGKRGMEPTWAISHSRPVASQTNSTVETPSCRLHQQVRKPFVTDDLSAITTFSTRCCSTAISRPDCFATEAQPPNLSSLLQMLFWRRYPASICSVSWKQFHLNGSGGAYRTESTENSCFGKKGSIRARERRLQSQLFKIVLIQIFT